MAMVIDTPLGGGGGKPGTLLGAVSSNAHPKMEPPIKDSRGGISERMENPNRSRGEIQSSECEATDSYGPEL